MLRLLKVKCSQGKCFPGARVLNVSAQILAILKGDESIGSVVLHMGVNDIKLHQTETLKRDFKSLIETVRNTSPVMTIIMSGTPEAHCCAIHPRPSPHVAA